MVERRYFDASRIGVNRNFFQMRRVRRLEVRILSLLPYERCRSAIIYIIMCFSFEGQIMTSWYICGSSSIGRAPAFQAGCCEFKSRLSLHRLSHGVVNSARIERYIQQFFYNRTCNPQMTCNSSCLPTSQVGGSSTVEQVYMYLDL